MIGIFVQSSKWLAFSLLYKWVIPSTNASCVIRTVEMIKSTIFEKTGTHVKSFLARFIMFCYLIPTKCLRQYIIKLGVLKNLLKQWSYRYQVPASAIFRQIWIKNNCWNIHMNRNLEANEWKQIWWKAKLIRKWSIWNQFCLVILIFLGNKSSS